MNLPFNYSEAFSRTLGWVTELELQQLRRKRIAIAGVGGVGGVHLLTLARLGIGAFNIADMDIFEQANFNRQAGAMMSTIGKAKVDVMADMARDINPELDIRVFPEGIGPANYDAFLRDVDLYVDGLDFFVFDVRAGIFAACARLGIPAVTVGPLGMGAAALNFLPRKMTFEEYFGFADATDEQKMVRFLVGLAPRVQHVSYLVDRTRADMHKQRGPSTPMACQICAGVAATEALKILLNRGKVHAAPHGFAYDAYLNKVVHTWRPGGYRNPFNRVLAAIVTRMLKRTPAKSSLQPSPAEVPQDTLGRILDIARWAQSGDNEQPWRFVPVSATQLTIQFRGHVSGDVYDYDGRPVLIALGCLAENLRLAASRFGWSMRWRYEAVPGAANGFLHVTFEPASTLNEDPLCDFVPLRSVDRRPYQLRPLTIVQKQALEKSLGPEFSLCWYEGAARRWRVARLASLGCQLRLSIRETTLVHQRIIDWDNAYSPDRVPARSVGSSAVSRHVMRWALADLRRALFIGRLPGGTWSSRFEMELLPGMLSAGYFMILRNGNLPGRNTNEATIRAGEAVQRFWLTATSLGLAVQPSVATLAFAYYGRNDIEFSATQDALPRARRLAKRFGELCAEYNADPQDVVFMGRIGTPQSKPLNSRSVRRPLAELIVT